MVVVADGDVAKVQFQRANPHSPPSFILHLAIFLAFLYGFDDVPEFWGRFHQGENLLEGPSIESVAAWSAA